MSKKAILLYRPKLEEAVDTKIETPPLALLTISGLLVEKGYEVKIFDALVDKDAQEKVLENLDQALCVGFTVWTGYPIVDSLILCKKIKKTHPHIPLIWGGWHPSILVLETLNNPYIDIIVKGQGEVTFFELIKCLDKKLPLDNVKGIAYKNKGKIIDNPDRPRIPLDDLPSLPIHLIDLEKYVNIILGKRTTGYVSSQGCPFSCAFCADSLIYNKKRADLSAKRVLKDLKNLIENYNIDSISFLDTNFFVNKDKVREICEGIIKNKWDIKWSAFERTSHFITFDKKTLELIKDSGCCLLVVGAESGSQKILDFLNKGIKVEDTIRFTHLCKEYGINVRYDFMVGLPNETPEDFQKTLNLIKKIYEINKNNDLSVQFYAPYPGTPLYDKVINEYGFVPPKSLIEWSEYDPGTKEMKWVSKEYKDKLSVFLFYLQFAFLNEHFKRKTKNLKFKFMVWPIHKIALLRLRFNFLKFPIEKNIYTIFRKILTIQN